MSEFLHVTPCKEHLIIIFFLFYTTAIDLSILLISSALCLYAFAEFSVNFHVFLALPSETPL